MLRILINKKIMKKITNILIAIMLILSMNNCQKDPVQNDPITETKKETYRAALERIHKNVMNDTSLDNIMYIDTTRFYGSFSSTTWDTALDYDSDFFNWIGSSLYRISDVPTNHLEYDKEKPVGIYTYRYKVFGWHGNDFNNNWGKNAYDTIMAIHIKDSALIATAPTYRDAQYLINSQYSQESFQQLVKERIKNQPAEIRDYILNSGETDEVWYRNSKKFIDPRCYQYSWEYDDRVNCAYFDIKAGKYNYIAGVDSENVLPILSSALVDYLNCYLNIKYIKLSDGKYHTVGYYKIFYKNIFYTDDRTIRPITGKIIMD